MYCAKCGNQIVEDAKFCNSCGEAVSQDRDSKQYSGNGVLQKKVSKHNNSKIIGAAVAVLVIIIGILLYVNMWRIIPDRAYYGYLEARNKPISFNDAYEKITKAAAIKSFSKDIRLSINNVNGLGMAESSFMQEMEISAQVDYNKEKGTAAAYVSGKYLDNILLDAIFYKDKGKIGFGIPVLYDKNFVVNKDEIVEALINISGNDADQTDIESLTINDVIKDLDEYTRTLDQAVTKYGKAALKNIPSSKIKVSAADDSVKIYTWKSGRPRSAMEMEKSRLVEVQLSMKDINKIMDKLLSDLEADDELLAVMADAYIKYVKVYEPLRVYSRYGHLNINMDTNAMPDREALIGRMKESIADTRNDLDSDFDSGDDDETVITMKIVADSKNNIISREIKTEDATIEMTNYVNDEKMTITEINVSEGDDGTGAQVFNVYLFNSEDEKGFNLVEDSSGKMSMTYKRNDKGKNNSGLDYGVYKASIQTRYEDVNVSLSTSKNDSNKDSDLYRLKVGDSSTEYLSCNIMVGALKSKSRLSFDAGKAIDLANTDQYELREIMYEIEDGFSSVGYNINQMLRNW